MIKIQSNWNAQYFNNIQNKIELVLRKNNNYYGCTDIGISLSAEALLASNSKYGIGCCVTDMADVISVNYLHYYIESLVLPRVHNKGESI